MPYSGSNNLGLIKINHVTFDLLGDYKCVYDKRRRFSQQ